jgi:hypothetical protein
VSALTGNDWNVDRGGEAVEMTLIGSSEGRSMRAKMFAVRDTLVVLVMQLVFRVTMLLRHLNY